ncbi:hypothetical protein [Micromonospora sp. CPCC 205561]|uniref:hypothetical protein n=1 Tax=Micromonospora sp. CPCC 205561 TaxID=3122407 RepID=UPI002FF36A92
MPVPRPANAVPATRWATRPAAATASTREDGTPRVSPGVYLLTREASPQFATPITVRVIRERTDLVTYHGWTWIEAYRLDARGDAIEHRELYVRPDGMRPTRTPSATRPTPTRRNASTSR